MKIVFANYLAAPFVFTALGILYYAWENTGDGAIWILPCVLIAAFIWVLSPQINWWWYSKRPPALETGIVQALERFSPFYSTLPPTDQQRFRDRLALTRMATDWTSKDLPDDEIPPDLETAIAVQSVIVTWNKEQYLFPEFEKVVISPSAFLSPELPFRHNSETYPPEQCLLFSAKAVIAGFTQPTAFFNVVLYEYAKIFLMRYPGPVLADETAIWEKIAVISGWEREKIETDIGIAGVEVLPVALCFYHTHRPAFKAHLPELAAAFEA